MTMFTRVVAALGMMLGVTYIANASAVFQEIAGLLVIATAVVLWMGGEIIDAILQLKQKIEEIENGKCKTEEG